MHLKKYDKCRITDPGKARAINPHLLHNWASQAGADPIFGAAIRVGMGRSLLATLCVVVLTTTLSTASYLDERTYSFPFGFTNFLILVAVTLTVSAIFYFRKSAFGTDLEKLAELRSCEVPDLSSVKEEELCEWAIRELEQLKAFPPCLDKYFNPALKGQAVFHISKEEQRELAEQRKQTDEVVASLSALFTRFGLLEAVNAPSESKQETPVA